MHTCNAKRIFCQFVMAAVFKQKLNHALSLSQSQWVSEVVCRPSARNSEEGSTVATRWTTEVQRRTREVNQTQGHMTPDDPIYEVRTYEVLTGEGTTLEVNP